jgi:hypothetical protein
MPDTLSSNGILKQQPLLLPQRIQTRIGFKTAGWPLQGS